MAKRDDTTKPRVRRSGINQATSTKPSASSSTDSPNPSLPSSCDSLKQSIEAERAQLMQAHAVVRTLSAALISAEDDDAMFYVDAANVAAELIDEAVGQLNKIDAGKGVKEPAVEYVFSEPARQDAPILTFPRGPGEGTPDLRH